jgi:hypothetical protein
MENHLAVKTVVTLVDAMAVQMASIWAVELAMKMVAQ